MRVLSSMIVILAASISLTPFVQASDAGFLTPVANEESIVSTAVAPVRSRAQLVEYVRNTAANSSPLNKLHPAQLTEFLDSLSFNETGLTGFNYAALSGLTVSDAYRVLALFGAQHLTHVVGGREETKLDIALAKKSRVDMAAMADYQNYRCDGRATCKYDPNYICMSGC